MINAATHSSILVPSLWRVLPITLSSQADMPSLITVALVKGRAFRRKKTIHTKSFSSSFTSFLDITPDLQYYLSLLSFTYNLHLCQFLHHLSITLFRSNQYTCSSLYFTNTHNCNRIELINTIAYTHLIYLQ